MYVNNTAHVDVDVGSDSFYIKQCILMTLHFCKEQVGDYSMLNILILNNNNTNSCNISKTPQT